MEEIITLHWTYLSKSYWRHTRHDHSGCLAT